MIIPIRNIRVIVGIAFLLSAALGYEAAWAAYLRCPNADVSVTFSEQRDGETACKGATDAIAFLKTQGIMARQAFQIHMVKKLPAEVGDSAFGCFDRQHGISYVLEYSACWNSNRDRNILGLKVNRSLHRSLVAHETAHAIISQNLSMKNSDWVAHEYIAYVVQLATMKPDLRKRVLAALPAPAFENPRKINSTVLMMAPDTFAARAYRHFMKLENGAAFFKNLLSGAIRLGHGLDTEH